MTPELNHTALQKSMQEFPEDLFEHYTQALLENLPNKPSYIVGYGSCLSSITQSKTSVPDFYVVVDDYKTFYTSKRSVWLNRFLVPNIYHFDFNDQIVKYSVISKTDLEKQVSLDADDVYHLGRFSKKIALVWENDPSALEHLTKIHKTAIATALTFSHQLHGPLQDLDDAIYNALQLSYAGDVRVESSDKVEKLFLAQKTYYQEAYAPIWKALDTEKLQKQTMMRFWIRKSRLRAQARWIKNIFTASSWIDYMIFKIERTQGIQIELTPLQRKLWFIYIWPIFFRLYKEKRIK